jgi:hypothetical protein
MRRLTRRDMRRFAIVTVIALAPIAILCAYVTNLLVPTSPLPKPATFDYVPTASIIESNETIGMADSDLYGLNKADGTLDTDAVDKHLAEMQSLGINTVRVMVPWAGIQPFDPTDPTFGSYRDWSRVDYIVNKASTMGMSVLGVLNATPAYGGENGTGCWGCVGVAPDPTKFAEFASEAAGHFAGKVSAYEVWNEPNYYQTWFPAVDPVAYTDLLKAAYTAIKTTGTITVGGVQVPIGDPNAMVVAGVLGAVLNFGNVTMDPRTFVETMYANDAKGFFDALSFHPYSYEQPFSAGLPATGCQFLCDNTPISMLLGLRQIMLENLDGGVKIWASEYGLATSIVSQEQQRDWIVDFLNTWAYGPSAAQTPEQYQALVADWKNWIGPSFIYTLQDQDPTTEPGSYGVFTQDWTEKLAAAAIRNIIQQRQQQDGLQQFFNQVMTQLFNTVSQALGQALANALAQALTDFFNNLFNPPAPATAVTTLGLTTEEKQAVVGGTEAAALSLRSATAEAASNTSTDSKAEAGASAATTEPSATESTGAAVTETTEPTETTTPTESTEPTETTEPTEPKTPTETTKPEATTEPTTSGQAGEAPTSDKPVAADDQKTSNDPKTTTPANRKDEDEVKGDSKKGDDKKSGGDKDADGATAPGKHAQGAVKDGTSVDEIKTKLGDDTATITAGTPKHAASEDATAATAATAASGG